MPTFRILASRTELYLIEVVVSATSRDEAETQFYAAIYDQGATRSWIEDYDGPETEIDTIELLPVDHPPAPSRVDSTLCLYCEQVVRWTGTPAGESPTGRTIPGPWIHVERPIAREGLGL